ncbi:MULTISPECIES: glycosyltransferase [unclassified Microcoleus]|uniref:glycosyltransferase n=1 Tax=unclassified Microcoleus TaxID=2642155 RepID=UPI002FD5F30E
MPKVSVIIPAYNAMAFLPETLESVLNQTFTDFEVLIINDGSPDGIVEWAAEIKDSRVKLISQENQGISGARNTGIWSSQGEYLAFLDADDIWESSKLEKQVEYLEKHLDVGLVSSWISNVDRNGNLIDIYDCSEAGEDLTKELFRSNILYCGSTPLIRRICFEKVGFFERSLSSAADWDMWLRIALHFPIFVIQEPLVRYRRYPNSMSTNFRLMIQELDQVMERSVQLAPEEFKNVERSGSSNLCTLYAWGYLIKDDFHEAFWFAKQAFIRRPKLIFSISYLHLIFLIAAKQFLKPQTYKALQSTLLFWKPREKK